MYSETLCGRDKVKLIKYTIWRIMKCGHSLYRLFYSSTPVAFYKSMDLIYV
jgi:ribosomal protein L37AE/L43A